MRENCTSGIAPGAPGNRRSYGGGAGLSPAYGSRISGIQSCALHHVEDCPNIVKAQPKVFVSQRLVSTKYFFQRGYASIEFL
jgi:hypothetical protein